MTEKDTYRSVAACAEGLYKDKGSRFIAFARPVETEDGIKEAVESLKKEYHDARHHCYAWRLGLDGGRWRANDDGEPSGTAGRQILGQIDSAGLSDVLVVVVRYFGGIKLGVPGLIKAYRSAAADALSKAGTAEKTVSRTYRVSFTYEQMPQLMNMLKKMDIQPANRNFTELGYMDLPVRLSCEQVFLEQLKKMNIFNDKIEILL